MAFEQSRIFWYPRNSDRPQSQALNEKNKDKERKPSFFGFLRFNYFQRVIILKHKKAPANKTGNISNKKEASNSITLALKTTKIAQTFNNTTLTLDSKESSIVAKKVEVTTNETTLRGDLYQTTVTSNSSNITTDQS